MTGDHVAARTQPHQSMFGSKLWRICYDTACCEGKAISVVATYGESHEGLQPMSLITVSLLARASSLTADGWVVGRLWAQKHRQSKEEGSQAKVGEAGYVFTLAVVQVAHLLHTRASMCSSLATRGRVRLALWQAMGLAPSVPEGNRRQGARAGTPRSD